MQQTNKYKLNLIEMSDTFSPAPLNENMEKVEAAITAEISAEAQARANADSAEAQARAAADTSEAQARANAVNAETQARIAAVNSEAQARIAADNAEAGTRAAADTALDARVQVLEAQKIAAGTYTGDGSGGVSGQFIELGFTPRIVLVQRPGLYASMAVSGVPYPGMSLVIKENGFVAVGTSETMSAGHNIGGAVYTFLAIL